MKTILTILLLITLMACGELPNASLEGPNYDKVERAKVFHGTLWAKDIDREGYFKRDGKRYKLFTKDFERRYENKHINTR